MPKFLQKVSDRLALFGYTSTLEAGTFPATLPGRLVPLAKRMNWYGYHVS